LILRYRAYKETTMLDANLNDHAERTTQDRDLPAQVCAYNTAFEELDLMFRWDEHTLAELAALPGDEYQRVAHYIERHTPHLLTAYSAEFLCRAIVDTKNQHHARCVASAALRDAHGQQAREPALSWAGALSSR
jgi:hypothetical protein